MLSTVSTESYRTWIDECLVEPQRRRIASEALDAFDRMENAATILPESIEPIVAAASCRYVRVWEIGADLLNRLAVRHSAAQNAIINLLRDRKADIRFHAIVLLGLSHLPGALARSLIRLGLRDRSYQVRGKVAEAACQLGLTDLIADLEFARSDEKHPIARKCLESLPLSLIAVAGGARTMRQAVAESNVQSKKTAKSAVATGAVSGLLAIILGFMLWPIVPSTIGALQLSMPQRRLEQIGLALRQYHDEYGSFPPVAVHDADGRPMLSWRVLILPFLKDDQERATFQTLYEQIHLDEPWDSRHNQQLIDQMPRVFYSPFDRDTHLGMTSYLAVSGEETAFPPGRAIRAQDIRDGDSLTILLIEVGSSRTPWTKPEDLPIEIAADLKQIKCPRDWGARFVLFANGKSRIVSNATDPNVWRALLTIAGGESVDEDDF